MSTVPTLAEQLAQASHHDLMLTLQRYQNSPNADHQAALHDILLTYSRFATGDGLDPHKRIAFPLATAMGKTQSIISWARAVHQMSLPYTLLVCQEQVRDLDILRHDLIDRGVPEDRIGLIHRDRKVYCSPGHPSEYQFLLITHAMIRTSKEAAEYMETEDGCRSLCVYDESLIKSAGRTVSGGELETASAMVETVLRSGFTDRDKVTPAQFELVGYLKDALAEVISRYNQRDTSKFNLPTILDVDTAMRYATAARGLPGKARDAAPIILRFLEIASEPLRVARLGQGGKDGVISYQLRIPPTLQNVVVLDASATVRELQEKDSDIVVIDRWESVKRFNKLSVDQYLVQSGTGYLRNTMTTASPILKDVVGDVTRGWLPENAAVVFCIAKQEDNAPAKKKTPTHKLQEALVKAGVNLNATVRMWEGPRNGKPGRVIDIPKYQFITWGQERSTNKFRHCSHLIAIGVSRRGIVELAGNVAGQRNDLEHEDVLDRSDLDRVQASEQFTRLQQFIGRGTTRETRDGQAGESWVKVYDHGDFTDFIQRGLPGCTWRVHEQATYAKNVNHKRRQTRKTSDRVKAEKAGIRYLEKHSGKVMVSEITALREFSKIKPGMPRTRILGSIEQATDRRRAGHASGAHFEPMFEAV